MKEEMGKAIIKPDETTGAGKEENWACGRCAFTFVATEDQVNAKEFECPQCGYRVFYHIRLLKPRDPEWPTTGPGGVAH
jgi:DNA-directed RNA polymerase subunit RPC12/RpoP